jgi:formylglycine-generating enzyme required for sulfatase activity
MPSHGRHTGRDIRHGTRKPRAGASTPRDQHEVAIKAFALGKYDVTSEQFLTFLMETGYQPRPCSTILDMKWKSPGHGQAYSPLNGEPPHWPAVCLDWHDVKNISPG